MSVVSGMDMLTDGAASSAASQTGATQAPSRSPSPGKRSQSGKRPSGPVNKQNVAYADLQSLYTDVLQKYREEVKSKTAMMQEAKRKDELVLRREARFREQIQKLQQKLDGYSQTQTQQADSQESIKRIRSLHTTIQDNILLLQNRTSQVLKDQERDLLRAFKTRMCDVNDELDRERRKNESGSSEWVQRCHKLTEELEWMKDMTYRLEEQNKQLAKDNKRLKSQLKTQEEDREFLIKQILVIKKDYARLRDAGAVESPSYKSLPTLPQSTLAMRPNSAAAAEAGRAAATVHASRMVSSAPRAPADLEKRFQNTVRHMRHEMKMAQTQIASLQARLNEQLHGRQELQAFLRSCVDDIREEILQRGGGRTADLDNLSSSEFNKAERSAVMARLFAQEKTLRAARVRADEAAASAL
ncbi:hypothetical protein PBRA_006600 [Plasmodiophora brassicae]|uniref:Cilia- and flagella-associated protein 157 n=1 Tax=Plasmodiophora brassicae TaxID=37360 RepID=A0A0G4ITN2_PLABS|nr:hypothetical protein PBRA_006600 [Plasmodiophora brassicae]